MEQILPELRKDFNTSANPNDHAIAGSSSAGIAARERPYAFPPSP